MDLKHRLERWFKLRFAILYPFGIYVMLFTQPSDKSLIPGIILIAAGLFIRLWANAYAIKTEKLTTSGPYAFVRHPLYLGTVLLFAGFVVMLEIYYLGLAFLVLIIVAYYKKIKGEETQLEAKFGRQYIEYKSKIPALLPTFIPYCSGEKWPFSWERLIRSKEYKVFIWVIIFVILFYLKDELMIKREKIDFKIISLIITAFCLGYIDLVFEFVKIRNKKQAK